MLDSSAHCQKIINDYLLRNHNVVVVFYFQEIFYVTKEYLKEKQRGTFDLFIFLIKK